MIAVDFQKVGGRSNFKFILFTSARLIAVALIIHQTCQLPSGAIAKFNRQKEVRQPELDRSVDKETRASDTYSSYHHPYGDSFEAIDGRLKSDLSVTPVDPMKTAATHHHHKKGAKGWLDMGAWTKKKGAFGWYADFPVGKGK